MSKVNVNSKLEDQPLSFLRIKSVNCHIHFQFEYPAIHEFYTRILDNFFAYYGACSHQQQEARISYVMPVLKFLWRQKSKNSSLADSIVRWTIKSNISETNSIPIIKVIWNGITVMMEMELVSEMLDLVIRLRRLSTTEEFFEFVRSVRMPVRTDQCSSH